MTDDIEKVKERVEEKVAQWLRLGEHRMSDDLRAILSHVRKLEGERDETAEIKAVCRELRDRLAAFVGALALSTDCSADVSAIARADAALRQKMEK